MIYHVSKNGNDFNCGSEEKPFLTIQKAADIMVAGDKVIVHEGTYREWVKPRNSGRNEYARITYEGAKGEHVVIKGSEVIKGWKKYQNTTWSVQIPNSFFENYNPFATNIEGDWLDCPKEPFAHTGEVYVNGHSLYECFSLEEVCEGKPFESVQYDQKEIEVFVGKPFPNPEITKYKWFVQVDEAYTTIYANFHEFDPNEEEVEINVRRSCFFPETKNRNYITVRNFEMAHSASKWAPPTSFQTGLIGPNWAKKWIIENNDIHDAKCAGISIGKDDSFPEQLSYYSHRIPGYQGQVLAVFNGVNAGWSFDNIGSHIIRNNKIHDCGQNGIVGHMGGIGSEICNNEIFNIGTKHEYFGAELGGIKLHAAMDAYIHNNYIHDCVRGTWLDWETEGLRFSSNIYRNNENFDLFVEVSHGPNVIDNNIFESHFSFRNISQGCALINNLILGANQGTGTVLNRSTPFHFQHSTQMMGVAFIFGADERFFNNIFAGGHDMETTDTIGYGTSMYNGYPISLEEFIEAGTGRHFEGVKQQVIIHNNSYFDNAQPFEREDDAFKTNDILDCRITDDGTDVFCDIEVPEDFAKKKGKIVGSADLSETRIAGLRYENKDGSDLAIDKDFLGNERNSETCIGPFENLKPGKNHILIWKR